MATLWQSHTFTVFLTQPGTTDTPFLTYDPDRSRVRIDETVAATIDGLPAPVGAVRVVERSTDLTSWVTVRGGNEQLVDGAAVPLDDYEFTGNAENFYRIRVLVDGVLFWTFRDQITVVLDAVWLKSVRRPFLNRVVTVTDYGDISRPARSGVFDVVGRSLPIAVTDLHGSQRFDLELVTLGKPAGDEMDLVIASGDLFYIQGPVDCPVPEGHFIVGDMSRARKSKRGQRRYFSLPLTQVASPSGVLTGATFTWRSMANTYATWGDVANAALSWRMVNELFGTARDVVVP